MAGLQALYDKSPIFFQNIMTSLKGVQNRKSRYGKEYYEYRDFLKQFDMLPLADKLEYQRKELVSFVKFAYENSEFYRKLYSGIDISKINSVEDLKGLPVVTKEMLRENIDECMVKGKESYTKGNTGGTTGKSLTIIMTDSDLMKRMAMLDHFKAKAGFEHLKMRRATFNGKHIVPPKQKKKVFWRYNAACKQMIYSSFHITEDNMGYYVESLNKFKPHALDGFFTSMCDVAGYIERHNIKLEFKPVAIFPTSETLTAEGRELLERVFGCKVYDQYASSEGAPFVCECENQVLHVELGSGVFEKYDNDEVLVTSFTTHGTPLIRYAIGDRMIFDEENKCSCKNNSPVVKSIEGRRLDYLYTAEGAKINAGNVSNILKYIPNAVVHSQFVQERKDEVKLLLEIDKKLYKHEEYNALIEKEFCHKFGENTRLVIEIVNEIPREKSGKFAMIKNFVDRG